MKSFFTFIFILFFMYSSAQDANKQLRIKKISKPVEIDGVLNEAVWDIADMAGNFAQHYPYDTSLAETQTEVRILFNDQYIYIGAICYDPLPGNYVIQSLKRDFSFPETDAFAVFIDPFNDNTNGFSFAVSPLGVQREGMLQGGGEFGVSATWDNKWYSAVTNEKDKWYVEIAIPFKTIRFKENTMTWGINFARNDLKRNEVSSWIPVPLNFNVASLSFTGDLIWDEPPPPAGMNISLIPYGIVNFNDQFNESTGYKYLFVNNYQDTTLSVGPNAGFDAKFAVTSSLNLDLTVNPDFSQVEVDEQIINLTGFSQFYPEKRQFFIENSDLFSQFGFRQIRPFFSRRIGLVNGRIVPIIAGARLSGKINKDWRIGVMNMQTKGLEQEGFLLNSFNYTVAAFQRRVLKRSDISAIFVNKQATNNINPESPDFNRVAGIDFNYASEDNRWQGKVFYHQAFLPENNGNQFAHAVWLMLNSKKIFTMWNHEYVGKNYLAEVGFVPRLFNRDDERDTVIRQSYWRFEPMWYYKFYPSSDLVNNIQAGIYLSTYTDRDFNLTENMLRPEISFNFQSGSNFTIAYEEWYNKLLYPLDLIGDKKKPLPAEEYFYRNGGLSYTSTKRKKFFTTLYTSYGSFYKGTRFSTGGEISFRWQPFAIFSLDADYNKIKLPAPYKGGEVFLLGPKMEFTFTKSLFFTTFIQYNTQINNLNINSRFQWRFKPMSDLYIVYTDNYFPDTFIKKNRALVIKLIYWITI